jgi:4-diphosphocytidyl-2-C-methyl-D-erythritol kinase
MKVRVTRRFATFLNRVIDYHCRLGGYLVRTNLWLGFWAFGMVCWATGDQVRPQGYRHVDFRKPYERTYGGYGWIDQNGDICEEGITVQGNPLICSTDTMLVLDAAAAEARDLHFVDGDIRRTWMHGARATAVHVFTKQCPDVLVGSWGAYEPVFFRFRPGIMVEDIRRPGYTETFGATHQVGALTYKTVRPRQSPLEVKQTWFIAGRWCVASAVELRNLTDKADDAAALAVGLNLRPPVNLDRGQLDWYADFHSNGKAGVPMVPRLSDAEYQKLTEITKFHLEYRPHERCLVARTGCDVRAAQPSYYFACLMLDAPVARHVLTEDGDAHQPSLFATGKSCPQQLVARSAVIGLRSADFPLGARESRVIKYAIAFGKTADEAVANARQGLEADAAITLMALRDMFFLPLDNAALRGIGARLGADVPFFLGPPCAIGRGIGDDLIPVEHSSRFWVVLGFPPFGVSTREVYQRYDPAAPREAPDLGALLEAMRRGDAEGAIRCAYNEMESLAFGIRPELGVLREQLEALSGRPVRMSGSGSTLFTLCAAEDEARRMAQLWKERVSLATAAFPFG